MMDAVLIETCADPSLTPALIEQFVATAGSDDPLAITVTSDGKFLLVRKPSSPSDVLDIMRQWVGKASVRVGVTQYPAGLGVTDRADLDLDLADACKNLRTGTAMFAKIARIVTHWYGTPTNRELLPQMFEDAIHAWKTGVFEGDRVFHAADPGGPTFFQTASGGAGQPDGKKGAGQEGRQAGAGEEDIGSAGIRVDLSRIGSR